jgi:hypothetical protein
VTLVFSPIASHKPVCGPRPQALAFTEIKHLAAHARHMRIHGLQPFWNTESANKCKVICTTPPGTTKFALNQSSRFHTAQFLSVVPDINAPLYLVRQRVCSTLSGGPSCFPAARLWLIWTAQNWGDRSSSHWRTLGLTAH